MDADSDDTREAMMKKIQTLQAQIVELKKPARQRLLPGQVTLLQIMHEYELEHQCAATIRELAELTERDHKSVHRDVQVLVSKGLVAPARWQSRASIITKAGRHALREERDQGTQASRDRG